MTQPGDIRDTITRVSAALTESTLRYHFTGGIVSSHYGEPRLTADVDVVLVLPNYDAYVIDKLISYLSNDFIVDDESIRASLKEMNGFQVIDRRNYLKVDIHVGERIGALLEGVVEVPEPAVELQAELPADEAGARRVDRELGEPVEQVDLAEEPKPVAIEEPVRPRLVGGV